MKIFLALLPLLSVVTPIASEDAKSRTITTNVNSTNLVTIEFCAKYKHRPVKASNVKVECWSQEIFPKCLPNDPIGAGITGDDGCVIIENKDDWEFAHGNVGCGKQTLDVFCRVYGSCIEGGIHKTFAYHNQYPEYHVKVYEELIPATRDLTSCSATPTISPQVKEIEQTTTVETKPPTITIFEANQEIKQDSAQAEQTEEKISILDGEKEDLVNSTNATRMENGTWTRAPSLEKITRPTTEPTAAPLPDPLNFKGPKCTNRLRNGDLEADDVPFNWKNTSKAFNGKNYNIEKLLDMEIVAGESGVGNALHVNNRFTWWASPQLDIDVSCFKPGQQLEFSARIKLEGKDGEPTVCTPGQIWGKLGITEGICPVMTLEILSDDGTVTYSDVGQLVAPYSKEWNSMYGIFSVTEEFLKAKKVTLKWYKYSKENGCTLDNVFIKAAEDGCGDLIKNGDGEAGDLRGWQFYGSNGVVHALEYSPDFTHGKAHLVSKNRQKFNDGIMTLLDTRCLNSTRFYKISAKFKLSETSQEGSTLTSCDYLGTSTKGSEVPRCPMMYIGAKNSIGASQFRPVAALDVPFVQSLKEWNMMTSIFQFFPNEISAKSAYVFVSGSPPGTDILIDDVSLEEYQL